MQCFLLICTFCVDADVCCNEGQLGWVTWYRDSTGRLSQFLANSLQNNRNMESAANVDCEGKGNDGTRYGSDGEDHQIRAGFIHQALFTVERVLWGSWLTLSETGQHSNQLSASPCSLKWLCPGKKMRRNTHFGLETSNSCAFAHLLIVPCKFIENGIESVINL